MSSSPTKKPNAKKDTSKSSGPAPKVGKRKLARATVPVQLWRTRGEAHHQSIVIAGMDLRKLDAIALTLEDGTVRKMQGPFLNIEIKQNALEEEGQASVSIYPVYDGKVIMDGSRYYQTA